MVDGIWHWIVHVMGVDLGVRYGKWVWYNFWSGIAGSFLVGMVVYLLTFYWHHTCHGSRWCFRWGKFPAAGGVFRLCYRHHPDLNGERPHLQLIHRLHREHQNREYSDTESSTLRTTYDCSSNDARLYPWLRLRYRGSHRSLARAILCYGNSDNRRLRRHRCRRLASAYTRDTDDGYGDTALRSYV